MGGEIAQAIAAADIPVVVKDIDQKFVDAALEKARAVTQGQLAGQVKKERITQEQADARVAEVMANITGTTSYAEFAEPFPNMPEPQPTELVVVVPPPATLGVALVTPAICSALLL